jgi:hypothetical protein
VPYNAPSDAVPEERHGFAAFATNLPIAAYIPQLPSRLFQPGLPADRPSWRLRSPFLAP